jgi:hypothetical protein
MPLPNADSSTKVLSNSYRISGANYSLSNGGRAVDLRLGICLIEDYVFNSFRGSFDGARRAGGTSIMRGFGKSLLHCSCLRAELLCLLPPNPNR